jgi:hypothetical protein
MRGKTAYFSTAPSSPAAKVAALALLFSGIAFVFAYPALNSAAGKQQAAPDSTRGSTWSNLKRREG